MLKDMWTNVTVPTAHVITVSMVHINLSTTHKRPYYQLSVVSECIYFVQVYCDEPYTSLLRTYSGKTPSGPDIYDCRVLRVQFTYEGCPFRNDYERDFKLHFLILPRDQNILKRLPDGTWNCTTSAWPQIKHLFPCNFRSECANSEDEEDCWGYTSRCGPDRISIADTCYTYVWHNITRKTDSDKVTWHNAHQVCKQRGGQLASLNTPQKMHEVEKLLMDFGDNLPLFVGMSHVPESLPDLYRHMWWHEDGTVVHYVKLHPNPLDWMSNSQTYADTNPWWSSDHSIRDGTNREKTELKCAVLTKRGIKATLKTHHKLGYPLCEFPALYSSSQPSKTVEFPTLNVQSVWENTTGFTMCLDGHFIHTFFACDALSRCSLDESVSSSCADPVKAIAPSFTCEKGFQSVPYTFVCDRLPDCSDGSDEHFCVYSTCDTIIEQDCSGVCVPNNDVCNNDIFHCQNGKKDKCVKANDEVGFKISILPPAVLTFTAKGDMKATALPSEEQGNGSAVCPDTHFQCVDNGYCLPVFVRCNKIFDCPGHEDEADCESFTCPGFYHCRGTSTCLHRRHLCDGTIHCPQCDDEMLCNPACPAGCTCVGLAFYCVQIFDTSPYQNVRYLDASGSGLLPENLDHNAFLVWLSLARCNIQHIRLPTLHNLRILDLSRNYLTAINSKDLSHLLNLQQLKLADNPLIFLFEDNITNAVMSQSLQSLDLSHVSIQELDPSVFSVFPRLNTLNLTDCGVDRVLGDGFQALPKLRVLDVHRCPFTVFPQDIFQRLDQLSTIRATNYKLCCPATLPTGFNLAHCTAPTNEISSCEALLGSNLYRVFLSVFATFAILGNLASFLFRVVATRKKSRTGFDVFVANLCMSDFLMGVYLAVIGVADRVYMGNYLWYDYVWQKSAACTMAGMLCLMSCEVSAFIICLITLDRLLVLCFTFSHIRFRTTSALLASGLVWITGLVLAVVPLLPMTSHWDFYSQNGVCIPLPITRNKSAGQDYAFQVLVVLNFVLFMIIALGQVLIYWSVQKNRMKQQDGHSVVKTTRDIALAQRLITVAVSDFLCWFPVGFLAMLAANGAQLPGYVNTVIVIFVIPINSSINPCLYTLNIFLERLRRQQEERILRSLMARVEAGLVKINVAHKSGGGGGGTDNADGAVASW